MPDPELTQAALAAPPLARAIRLAEWTGDGRELTSTGVLRPAAAVAACQALDLELPSGKLRSAKDVAELQQAWEVAVAGGLVLVTANRARAARDVAELTRAAGGDGAASPRPELAERVMLAWVRGAGVPLGFPDDPCPHCLTVLRELSVAAQPVDLAGLADAVREAAGDAPAPDTLDSLGSYVCPDCGQVHDAPLPGLALRGLGGLGDLAVLADLRSQDFADHAETAVRFLVQFGAATAGPLPGGTVALTPLGRVLAASVMGSLAPAADADAETLVARVAGLPPKVAIEAAAPWLAARKPAGAVRELLRFAENFDGPMLRLIALEIARKQGAEAAPAWREYAKRAGFGAYARQWLADQGEPAPADDRDEAWLLVDTIVQTGSELPAGLAPFVFAAALHEMAGESAPELLADIRDCGHPQAAGVARIFSEAPGTFGGLVPLLGGYGDEDDIEEGALFQLKITLRGVSKPPVWRRVLVPAAITLGELHEVILRAMGWHGGHLHVFGDGMAEYGTPDPELGHADETEVELADLITDLGERICYTYDFGDDWEHDIKLEKILPPDAAAEAPVCLAGKGACPPEDCGGAWGYADLKEAVADPGHEGHEAQLEWLGLDDPSEFDPAEFSIEEANARLRRPRLAFLPR